MREKSIHASGLGKCLETGRVEHDRGPEEHSVTGDTCVGRKRIWRDVAGERNGQEHQKDANARSS